jgi:SPP1 family phage portal protein
MMSGYFMGEPVKYSSSDEELLEVVKANYNYNDEAAENTELAKNASIYGVSYELMYLDEDKQIRFNSIPTIGCIPIVEKNIEEDLLYFIRYYDEENILTGDKERFVEVYSRTYY